MKVWGVSGVILALLLSGCSGKTEDVRIGLCRALSTTLLNLQQPPQWLGLETRIKRPSYAEIELRFKATSPRSGQVHDVQAACFYDYVAVEENVITHTDPLSAYSTLPFKMTMNGREIPKAVINDGVNAVVRKQGKAMLEKAQRGFREAMGVLGGLVDGR